MNFSMTRDISGSNSFAIPFNKTSFKWSGLLASTVAQTVTVPSAYSDYIAVFGYEIGATVWIADNDTAAYPTGAMGNTSSDPNPVARLVKAGDVLSFITLNTTAQVWVSFFPNVHS